MTTRPPIIDRPRGEVFVGRPIPEQKPEDGEHGWVWDDVTGQIIGYEGINPGEDTLRVTFRVGALTEEFIIPPGTKERIRLDLPLSRRLACRRATIADHPWQQAAGWVLTGVESIHTERIYARPVRNSPSIASVAVTEFFGGATTTHNVPMPATVDAGDLLLVGWFHDNASLTQASGFAPLSTATNTDRCYIFGRVAVGDEDGANVNFQALTASFAVAHTYRITAGTWAGVLSGVMVTAATGTSATPDPPNNAPHLGSDDYLWLVFAGKVQASITGAPTNYTNFTGDSSDLSGSARRSLTASSEDPGTFSGSSSFAWMAFTIAIASDDIDLGDIPVFVSVGNTSAGTAGVTAALPGGIQTGDKLLLHIQGEGEDANADPANADWTLVDTQASATGGTAGDTRLTVYEVDYDSGDPPSLSIGDAGDHIICFITAWRDPNGSTLEVHQFQGTTDATADTSLSATGVTTTADNCLIVVSVGLGDDSGVLTFTNASLAAPPITHAGSDRTTSGSDGSLGVAFGGLASQGASGTTTGTLATSEEEANIVLALVAVSAGGPQNVDGALFSVSGVFGLGVLSADYSLVGDLFSVISSFNAGVVSAENDITGQLFTVPGSWPLGVISPGGVDLSGVLFSVPASFSQGATTSQYGLAGNLFSVQSQFGLGVVSPGGVSLAGELFTVPGSFFQGSVAAAYDLSGQLFSVLSQFAQGSISPTYQIAGNLFQVTGQFGLGSVLADQALAGALFSVPGVFSLGELVLSGVNLLGQPFVVPGQFNVGSVSPGGVILAGELASIQAQFGAGTIHEGFNLLGQPYTVSSQFHQGVVSPGVVVLDGSPFMVTGQFGAGVLSGAYDLTGQLFSILGEFGVGQIVPTNLLTGTPLVVVGTFPAGSVTNEEAILMGELMVVLGQFHGGVLSFVAVLGSISGTRWPEDLGRSHENITRSRNQITRTWRGEIRSPN